MSAEKSLASLVLAIAAATGSYAQDSLSYSTISLSAGINFVSNKDVFQSPYTYRGANLLLAGTYKHLTTRGQHMVDLSYSGGKIKSSVSPQAKNNLLLFNYDYLFNIRNQRSNQKV